jgi:hypothetical protein
MLRRMELILKKIAIEPDIQSLNGGNFCYVCVYEIAELARRTAVTNAPQPSRPPPLASQRAAEVIIPSLYVTWPKILSLCGAILVAIGGGFLVLINLVYGNVDRRISDLQGNIGAIQNSLISSARDAGSLQVLLNEAPEIRKNIQDTHDAVLKYEIWLDNYEIRFDNIDKSVSSLNSAVAGIGNTLARIEKQSSTKK